MKNLKINDLIKMEKDIYINCRSFEAAQEFLEECSKMGIKWVTGNNVTFDDDFHCWNYYKENTVYIIKTENRKSGIEKKLTYQSMDITKDQDVIVI